jgi:hypothetical protein
MCVLLMTARATAAPIPKTEDDSQLSVQRRLYTPGVLDPASPARVTPTSRRNNVARMMKARPSNGDSGDSETEPYRIKCLSLLLKISGTYNQEA